MQRMGVLRRGGLFAMVAVFGLATVLGGCTADKKKAELATQEAAELREANAKLEQSNRDMGTRMAELENRTAAAPAEEATPAPRSARNRGEGTIIKNNAEG